MSGKGSDYRPICDTWLLAPGKVGYYGAYPNGFLQRARCLLCRMDEPLLHVCSGRVVAYPGYGLGPYDETLDINPNLNPDYLQDASNPFPHMRDGDLWPAILMDPPYTPGDAEHYCGYSEVDGLVIDMAAVLPKPSVLLKNAYAATRLGGKIGLLHQYHPKAPPGCRLVACIQVVQGANQQPRCFTVFEKEFKF